MTFRTLGLGLAVVFTGLSALHVFWAAGGRWGASVVVPRRASARLARPGESCDQPVFTPRPGGTLLVAMLLLVAAGIVLAESGWLVPPVDPALIRGGTVLLGGVLVLRAIGDFRHVGLFRSVRSSDFARYDAFLFTPLCLILGAGALWLGILRP